MMPACQSASQLPTAPPRLGTLEILALSAACGLASGELEAGTRIVSGAFGSDRLLLMTRHFVWLVPLIDLGLFLGIGGLLAMVRRVWPRRAAWLSPRFILTLAIFPVLLEAGRSVYSLAWLVLAMGIASVLSSILERHPTVCRRWTTWSVPVLLAMVLLQAGWVLGTGRLKQRQEDGRPLPPAVAPNVLLVVLDTVRADHLSLYGYDRPTTPNLGRLAARGVRFDQARTAAPWTLASHSTMFTGRWPHELGSAWMQPLRSDVPTLAEFLGWRGYATAGFVGNTFYCSYDSGLSRGFTQYRDYVVDTLSAVRTVQLIDRMFQMIASLADFLAIDDLRLRRLIRPDRKNARDVNGEFLDWLSRRGDQRRPFFAFLNYADAHAPYVLPGGEEYRFGLAPQTNADFVFLLEAWTRLDKRRLTDRARRLGRDSYDNCIAYIDQCLGELLDELRRRGVLDRTFVIVAADHGEGLGEHELFDHGESLYRPETRVPLVLVPPGGRGQSPAVVNEFVSLRDLAATIAEVAGAGTDSPFPSQPLTRFLGRSTASTPTSSQDALVLSELASPNPTDPNQGRSPAYRGPLISLAEGDYVYVRNEGDGSEELFNERNDPYELTNHARDEALLPVLNRFRDRLDHAKAPGG